MQLNQAMLERSSQVVQKHIDTVAASTSTGTSGASGTGENSADVSAPEAERVKCAFTRFVLLLPFHVVCSSPAEF